MLDALKALRAAQRGAAAEQRAERQLQQQGLRALTRNWRCRHGELDLVMADGDTLVIVEVRARHHSSHGGAAASVDGRKQARLARATLAFVQAHPAWSEAAIRFDVVAFEAQGPGEWIRDAFQMDQWP